VSLIANVLEMRGVPTLLIGTVRDIMEQAPAPRSVFVDFPVGRTFGRPDDPQMHQTVLAAALAEFSRFTEPKQLRDLPFQWAGGDRSWEELIRQELRPRPPI